MQLFVKRAWTVSYRAECCRCLPTLSEKALSLTELKSDLRRFSLHAPSLSCCENIIARHQACLKAGYTGRSPSMVCEHSPCKPSQPISAASWACIHYSFPSNFVSHTFIQAFSLLSYSLPLCRIFSCTFCYTQSFFPLYSLSRLLSNDYRKKQWSRG
jgi:hypothetical protein